MREMAHLIDEGRFFFRSQKFKKAEEIFKQVIEQKREYADVHNFLGLIAHEEGRYGEAMDSFKEALRINPRYTEAMLNLSILYNDVGKYDEAKKLVAKSKLDAKSKSTSMDPFIRSKLANKHAEVADWYHGVGAFSEAIAEYKKALTLEEGYTDIRTKMAVCMRENGDVKGALEELKQAVKSKGRCVDAYIQLGITYYAAGKKTDARKTWKEAEKKYPANKSFSMYLKLS